MNESEREKVSNLIDEITTARGIKRNNESSINFKESFLFEEIIGIVENYLQLYQEKKMEYEVEVEFIEKKTIKIETESEIAAKEIALDKIQNGEIDEFKSAEDPSSFIERIVGVTPIMDEKRYEVKIPVYETISVLVKTKETDKDMIIQAAVRKAIEEQEKVCWQVDDDRETELRELE